MDLYRVSNDVRDLDQDVKHAFTVSAPHPGAAATKFVEFHFDRMGRPLECTVFVRRCLGDVVTAWRVITNLKPRAYASRVPAPHAGPNAKQDREDPVQWLQSTFVVAVRDAANACNWPRVADLLGRAEGVVFNQIFGAGLAPREAIPIDNDPPAAAQADELRDETPPAAAS